MLHGREAEQAAIDRLLAERTGVMILRGEAGIGKTALLEYAASAAKGRVLRVSGVESEAELPFAALHLLLRPMLGRIAALPDQQADALMSALGLGRAAPGDRFLVRLATLSLLTELAADQPLVCLVDDAQWLDQESADALLFAARRLHAEPIALLFAARDDGTSFPAPGQPELWLTGLARRPAASLLAERADGLPLAVRELIVEEAQGNPLALLELPRTLTAEQRAGAIGPPVFSLGGAEPVSGRVLAGFRTAILELPAATRSCLLVAALDDSGDIDTLYRALRGMGVSLTDFAPAERAGLVVVTPTGVAFRHPLVRTATRLAADVAQRVAAHHTLAGATDEDRRAWHLAAVATGPDERVAGELEEAAIRAARRSGQAAASAGYERAARLSADPPAAARRWAAAAAAALDAGLRRRAEELTRRACPAADPVVAAELARVRATLAFEAGRPLEAIRLFLDGVEALAPVDPEAVLPLASMASVYIWSSTPHPDQLGLARRIADLTPLVEGPLSVLKEFSTDVVHLLEGDDTAVFGMPYSRLGHQAALPFELRAIRTYLGFVHGRQRMMLEDANGLVAECRQTGRVGRLPQAMLLQAVAQILNGRHRAARAGVSEGLQIAADNDQPYWDNYLTGVSAWLAAVAGAEEECRRLMAQACAAETWMTGATWATYAAIMLDLGAARYTSVLERMDERMNGPGRHAFIWRYAYPDYVEAAVRVGSPERARDALERFATWARAIGQPWALAVLERCHALTTGDGAAYERALALHREAEHPFEQARTELLYGEWLRRHQRRAEARTRLNAAVETFARLGAAAWSARAAAELRATGVSPSFRDHGRDPLATLTPQELHVVRLAAGGASNREIGTQLFLSPRTVAYHLYKAFPKLGITSRAELARFVMT
ncbi:helix-turn-helix transcriptional regulator [Microbispora triticiradicis]|uniref:helix-turn-helix transcriptional regulator n=1 Tax=Microbispora triticiradicis TaxID=2200763 RepID=UPI001AD6241F|nr:helix-turn-helix transcriptional regulator [Microbispora triticiradicis]MBO4273963.1 AAA family ATPase [Microbispora triticiradicis]